MTVFTGHEAEMNEISAFEASYDAEPEFRATLAMAEQRVAEFLAGTYEDEPVFIELFGPATLERLHGEVDAARSRLEKLLASKQS